MDANRFKFITTLVVMTLTIVSPNLAVADGGSDVGGGNEIGLEFMGSFFNALKVIRLKDQKLAREVANINPLADLIESSILVVQYPLFVLIDGIQQESVATNDRATGLIRVNEQRWRAIRSPRVKEGIALHEVLSLKKVERTGYYPISGRYLAYFGLQADTLNHGKLRYDSPLRPDRVQQEMVCAAERRAGPQLLRDFKSAIERYAAMAKDRTQPIDRSAIQKQIHELDQWIMDLISTRNCYVKDRDRSQFDRAIEDGSSVRVDISAMSEL